MNGRNVLLLAVLCISYKIVLCQDWVYLKNQTYTYDEVNEKYAELASDFPEIVKVNVVPGPDGMMKKMRGFAPDQRGGGREEKPFGVPATSDAGLPIYHIVLDKKKDGETTGKKATLLINNAIHPGEPCGVDASLKLTYDLLHDPELNKLLDHVRIVIIPMYNIGGALRRGQSRVNQPGPEEYGFRGNAKNLDLNRDFIKADSRNAHTFARIYHRYNPEVFIDAHTTNGYDYQYGMGLLATHPDKLHPELAAYMEGKMLPFLYKDMEQKGKEITPYVYGKGQIPEDGLKDYLDNPRYSTGYTALFNTIGFITEAHKYKPYKDRVEYTYAFFLSTLNWMAEHAEEMVMFKKQADEDVADQEIFPIAWREDTVTNIPRSFKGYESHYEQSDLTGGRKLIYDRKKPFTKEIDYYNHFIATDSVVRPAYYVVPQAWTETIRRLRENKVRLIPLKRDTVMEVTAYYIDDFQTVKAPYEGHYLHYATKVREEQQQIRYFRGDVLVPVQQPQNRYIIETLEPHAVDSYFNWNFFDAVLQQKEWFSPYMFEETAKEVLEQNPELKSEFEQKKQEDDAFAHDHFGQLYFIYRNSPYFEPTFRRYPVTRINR